MVSFQEDINQCITVLEQGGLILYPTDTIWGIGCDAQNESAVEKIFRLKQREDSKSLIILLSGRGELHNYIEHIPANISDQLSNENPTTIIYPGGKNVAGKVLGKDGSIAIRLVKDSFCTSLIKQFGRAIISTSANISGMASPRIFNEIQDEIKNGVDYIVTYRREDEQIKKPSTIFKIETDGRLILIR